MIVEQLTVIRDTRDRARIEVAKATPVRLDDAALARLTAARAALKSAEKALDAAREQWMNENPAYPTYPV